MSTDPQGIHLLHGEEVSWEEMRGATGGDTPPGVSSGADPSRYERHLWDEAYAGPPDDGMEPEDITYALERAAQEDAEWPAADEREAGASCLPVQDGGFNYSDGSAGLGPYAVKRRLVVPGRAFANQSHYTAVAAGGGVVMPYVNVIDYIVLGPFDRLLMPSWTPRLGVSNWGGAPMVDTANDAYQDYVATQALPKIFDALCAVPGYKAIFWDVMWLNRLWSSGWNALGASGQQRLRDGQRRFVPKILKARDDYFARTGRYIAYEFNGTRDNGDPLATAVDGWCVEHHALDSYWAEYVRHSKSGMCVPISTQGAAAWRNVEGCAWVAPQASYDHAPGVSLSPHEITWPAGGGTPPQPPPPDPPPPVADVRPKSFTLTTERAADGGTIVRGRVETDHRDVPLIIARRKYPWGEERCWRYGLEHSLRWGKPPALPSAGVVTFRDHLLPGRQACYRAFHYPGGMPDCTGSHTSGIECGYLDSTPLKVP